MYTSLHESDKFEPIAYGYQGHCQYDDDIWEIIGDNVFNKFSHIDDDQVESVDLAMLIPYLVLAGATVEPINTIFEPAKEFMNTSFGYVVFIQSGKREEFKRNFREITVPSIFRFDQRRHQRDLAELAKVSQNG